LHWFISDEWVIAEGKQAIPSAGNPLMIFAGKTRSFYMPDTN